MKAFVELAVVAHPAKVFRMYVPFDISKDVNITEILCLSGLMRLVAESNVIADLTNKVYIKNRTQETSSISDDAMGVFMCFPLTAFEQLKQDYHVENHP